MEQILVYADSLSWGIIPQSRQRQPFDRRWPGVMESELLSQGLKVRVIENCLNGRRSAWSDPFKAGRDGSEGLAQVIEMHSPLKLVIIMLGHNDFQNTHDNDVWLSAQGIAKLIGIIRQAPIEPGMPVPEILVIAPPQIMQPKGAIAPKFSGAAARMQGYAEALAAMTADQGVDFFDSNSLLGPSQVDGIHLDEAQHPLLGRAVAARLRERFF
ncbi:SGNH/GDSL hydrolase family protein [Marinobacterium jannaschii]|uniref:SGNH/GDSL hydrolase family protein n=1 Tax=Marinobacterium jannaschii TaxID=64970 RepID=UPI000559E9DE|nr:SGNH/GDSL hydrolase family protein [Marinobacterium jannaschii]